jgi:dTDP-4-dehydrorhamnose reductase
MKLWIVGAGGLLGQTLLECCRKLGIEAVGTLRSEADVVNKDQLKGKALEIVPTHIVNCAAYTDVDGAEKNKEAAFAINCDGAANLAQIAKDVGCRFVHISTDYVFDGTKKTPYSEEDLCAPINVYGESKWAGEKKVLELLPSACVIRTSWLFGPGGKSFVSSLLHHFEQKEELPVVCDQWGKPTLCSDLAEAILALLNAEGIVHFANEGGRSRFQIAQDMWEAAQRKGLRVKCRKMIPVRSSQFVTPALRPSYSMLATERYVALTGKQPRRWREAMEEFLTC